MRVIDLVSPGGDLDEAIKIGRSFRKYLMSATAPHRIRGHFLLTAFKKSEAYNLCEGADCVCASACTLIWFGAIDRAGVVGLHRPLIDGPAFKSLPPAEAIKTYRRTIDDITHYMDDMEAPRSVIDAMVATGSSEVHWIDSFNNDLLERPASYAEWEDATCGEFTAQHKKTIMDLHVQEQLSQLTPNDVLLLKMLSDKEAAVNNCRRNWRTSHVEQLSPP
jgi:hypothetical protein